MGGPKGLWAAGVMREKVERPREVWEDEESVFEVEMAPTPSPSDPPIEPAVPPVSGSVFVTGDASVHLVNLHHTAPPVAVSEYALTRKVMLVPESVADMVEEMWASRLQPSNSPPRGVIVNPYIHRGVGYSAARGPAIRRRPMATSRAGDRLYRMPI